MRFKLQLKELLKGQLSAEELALLPSGYKVLGNIAIVGLDPRLEAFGKAIGSALQGILRVKAVYSRQRVEGELRKPGMVRLAGRGSVAVHKENGCLYKMDVSRLMFSAGNSLERGRVIAGDGERVVDMFAGIGYFTIGIAKRTPGCSVVAIEKNPLAAKYLKENVRLNRLDNVDVVVGDCREVDAGSADRVVMGYFPGTDAFLEKAFSMIRVSGVIHYHDVFRKAELWRKPLGILESRGLESGLAMEALHKRIVKPYAPHAYHVVVDGKFTRIRSG